MLKKYIKDIVKAELAKQKELINELEKQLESKTLKNGNLQFKSYGDKYVINTLKDDNEKLLKENKNLKSKLSQQELVNKMLVMDKEKYTNKLNNYQNMVDELSQATFKLERISSNHEEIKDYVKNMKNNYIVSKYSLYEPQYIVSILDKITSILNEE